MNFFNESGENDFDALLAEMEKEMSMGDIIKELGYGCTIDAEHCKDILSLCLPLTEMTISRILGTIACTYVGLEDNQTTFSTFSLALGCSTSSDLPPLNSWNIDVLIKTIKQFVSYTFFAFCNSYRLSIYKLLFLEETYSLCFFNAC